MTLIILRDCCICTQLKTNTRWINGFDALCLECESLIKIMFKERLRKFNKLPEPYIIPQPKFTKDDMFTIPIHKFNGEYFAESDKEIKQYAREGYLGDVNLIGYYYISKDDMRKLFPNAKRFSQKMISKVSDYHNKLIKVLRTSQKNDFKSITLDKYGRELP